MKNNIQSWKKLQENIEVKNILAFSLVELMVSLVVVSCITAVLTPIITKKLKTNSIAVGATGVSGGGGGGAGISSECNDISANCELCNSDGCLYCKNTCGAGTYLNTTNCGCAPCPVNCDVCTDATTCTKCSGGYSLNGNSCSECSAGTYGENGINCEDCPSGYYQANTGSSTCMKCEKGSYSNSTASTNCTPCAVGYYSSQAGSTECNPCPAGYYSSSEGSESCTKCGSGTYQDSIGQSSCKDCEIDHMCPAGSTGQTMCAMNYGAEAKQASCSPCTDANCADCRVPSTCLRCISGYYLSGASCIICPPDATCNGTNTIACSTLCASCNSSTGICSACVEGYELSTANTCVPISAGGTCNCVNGDCIPDKSDLNNCYTCNDGYVLTADFKCEKPCLCQNGQCRADKTDLETCVSCNAGYYLNNGTCNLCSAGYACPGGTAGATQCTGYTYAVAGSSKCTDAKTCGGIFGDGRCTGVDRTKQCVCNACPNGYYLRNGLCYQS